MKQAVQRPPRLAALVGLAVLLAASGCASPGPRAARWTPPPVGATWEFDQRSTGSYGRDALVQVSRGDGTWQGQSVVTLATSLGTNTQALPNGRWMAITGRDGQALMSWDPPLGFDYPLEVGKSWVTPYRMTIASGRTIAYDLTCKVESHGKVTVKAGTFDAFQVACTTTIGNEETYWANPDMGVFVKTRLRRLASSPLGAGTQESELAAVPAVRR